MRRIIGIVAAGAIVALAVAQGNGSALLSTFAKTLNSAKTVSSTYTVQIIGSAAESYSITLEKPNKARIDTPTQLVVANGTEMTVLDKAAKTYYTKPQTEEELRKLFSEDELSLFAGFFAENAYPAAAVKNLGEKNRKGQTVQAVQTSVDPSGKKVVTYFVGKDNLARAAQTDLNDPSGKVTAILDTKTFEVGAEVAQSAFAFQAPAGAKQISLDELNSAKWYTNLHEAVALATKTNRKIFVDFFATWCGPCKMLDREVLSKAEFKQYSSKLVFLRIDVDAQPEVSKRYNIEAMPTQMVLDNKGGILSSTVGYGGPGPFYKWLEGAVGRP